MCHSILSVHSHPVLQAVICHLCLLLMITSDYLLINQSSAVDQSAESSQIQVVVVVIHPHVKASPPTVSSPLVPWVSDAKVREKQTHLAKCTFSNTMANSIQRQRSCWFPYTAIAANLVNTIKCVT